jgi:hypothetical protein
MDDYKFDGKTQEIINDIVRTFDKNVRGKKPSVNSSNSAHDGKYGHWLERQMGIKINSKNEPDLLGFEMKNDTKTKTTFGDWSADYYLFKDPKAKITRHQFMTIFGQYNKDKDRYSWSGKPFPKYGKYNDYGQILIIDKNSNLVIIYNYRRDSRTDKEKIVPEVFKKSDILLARWDAEKIKKKVENKFKKLGWFKCTMDKNGTYTGIVFAGPLKYSLWLEMVKEGIVYLDSGMYSDLNKPNIRPYSSWRAGNKYWDSLIIKKY